MSIINFDKKCFDIHFLRDVAWLWVEWEFVVDGDSEQFYFCFEFDFFAVAVDFYFLYRKPWLFGPGLYRKIMI